MKYQYIILDNKCNIYRKEFINDSEALTYLRKNWKSFIVSVLSNDQICLYNSNKFLIATVNTSNGFLDVK